MTFDGITVERKCLILLITTAIAAAAGRIAHFGEIVQIVVVHASRSQTLFCRCHKAFQDCTGKNWGFEKLESK
jgi:hypothetical protein